MFPAMYDTACPIYILAPGFNPLIDPYVWASGEGSKGFGGLLCRGIPRVRAARSRQPREESPRGIVSDAARDVTALTDSCHPPPAGGSRMDE
jgi:hypothetical protein